MPSSNAPPRPFSRLRNLLPSFNRYAYFRVKLTIHEITNVPLVTGNFSVSYKFRGGRGGEVGWNEALPSTSTSTSISISPTTAEYSSDDSDSVPSPTVSLSTPVKPQILINGSEPSTVPSPKSSSIRSGSTSHTTSGETFSTMSSSLTASSKDTAGSSSSGLKKTPSRFGSIKKASESSLSLTSTTINDNVPPPNRIAQASKRGTTPIRPVHDHAVSWECSVTQYVRMTIHPTSSSSSSTINVARPNQQFGMLGAGPDSESGLKLKIHRHHPLSASNPSAPVQTFGVVKLDLAEYCSPEAGMGKGGIRRRYLLKEGKTNATIKLTIETEWAGGEKNYETPTLQRGGVVAGIETLGGIGAMGDDVLEHRKIRPTLSRTSTTSTTTVSTRAGGNSGNQSDFYSSRAPSSTSLVPTDHIPNPSRPRKPADAHMLQPPSPSSKRALSPSPAPSPSPKPARHRHHHHHHAHQHGGAGSALSAERVIEAIFNPYPSNTPGPFTVPYAKDDKAKDSDKNLETLMFEQMMKIAGKHGGDGDETIKKPGRSHAGERLRTAFGSREHDGKRDKISNFRHSKIRDGKAPDAPKPSNGITMASTEMKGHKQGGPVDWPSDTGKAGWGRPRPVDDLAAPDGPERDREEEKYSAGPPKPAVGPLASIGEGQ